MPKLGLNMNNRWSNVKLKGQTVMKEVSTESWWNKESNEINIKQFGLKIREKSLFQNQQKSAPKFGRNDEQFNISNEITYLNLI